MNQHPIFAKLPTWLQPHELDSTHSLQDLQEKAGIVKAAASALREAKLAGVEGLDDTIAKLEQHQQEAEQAVADADEAGLAWWPNDVRSQLEELS